MSTPDIAPEQEPVLRIDTLIKRPFIEIDGVKYEILSPDEIGVIDSHRFSGWGRRIELLAQQIGEDAEKELKSLVDQVARKVLVGVPDETIDKLSGAHKMAVAEVFTVLLLRSRLGVAGAIAKAVASPSTGATWSPGSSASTAGTPGGGWRKRLARWFALT
jgi:hypothetical protein